MLGTSYAIYRKAYNDDETFERDGCIGYCAPLENSITLCKLATHPNFSDCSPAVRERAEKEVLRHELIHAFLNESGLQESSLSPENVGWARNEEMVDWFALQFPKLVDMFTELDAI